MCYDSDTMTLHLVDKFGREIHSKTSGNIAMYSVNSLLTVLVNKDFPVAKVIKILESVPDV